jgi:hypothetical protein
MCIPPRQHFDTEQQHGSNSDQALELIIDLGRRWFQYLNGENLGK